MSARAASRQMGHRSTGPLYAVIAGNRRLTESEALALSYALDLDVASFGVEIVEETSS